MHSKGILVQVEHPTFGSAKGSGLLINNIVIAHGSLLLPLCLLKNDSKDVKEIYNSLLKDLECSQYFFKRSRPAESIGAHSYKFKVHHKAVSALGPHHRIEKTHDVSRSVDEKIHTEEATMCLTHYYKRFSGITEEISNWTLIDKDKEVDNEQSLLSVVLPTFFFLMIGEPCKDSFENTLQAFFKTSKHIPLYPGTPVVIESTPFGNHSFMSSWSHGIISKTIGYKSDGFLTDSRLVYGCEGAPVYL